MQPQVGGTFARATRTVEAQDRVTLYGWKALAGSVLGYAMDGFDLLILGFMLAAVSADLVLTTAHVSGGTT